MQVAGAAVIFEVQRSAKSEARKEEARAQELQVHFLKNKVSLYENSVCFAFLSATMLSQRLMPKLIINHICFPHVVICKC